MANTFPATDCSVNGLSPIDSDNKPQVVEELPAERSTTYYLFPNTNSVDFRLTSQAGPACPAAQRLVTIISTYSDLELRCINDNTCARDGEVWGCEEVQDDGCDVCVDSFGNEGNRQTYTLPDQSTLDYFRTEDLVQGRSSCYILGTKPATLTLTPLDDVQRFQTAIGMPPSVAHLTLPSPPSETNDVT